MSLIRQPSLSISRLSRVFDRTARIGRALPPLIAPWSAALDLMSHAEAGALRIPGADTSRDREDLELVQTTIRS